MTAVIKIATDTVIYSVVPDTSIERVAFVTGSVVDEVTGKPVERASVRVDRRSVLASVVTGGYFAASGSLGRVAPDHATVAWSIAFTFTAPRYRPRTVTVPIAAAALFPVNGGIVRLRPLPVRLEGRVSKEADRTAIAGATVAVKSAQKALLLRTTAHADHASGISITPVTLANAGLLRHVAAAVKGGATLIQLDDVGVLGAGSVLRFGTAQFEYAVVDFVDTTAKTVALRDPLTRSYASGAEVQGVTATADPGAVATTRSIDAGDGLLVLAAPLAATVIEISDPPHLEYHEVNAVSDGGGFFAADGIAGIHTLTLTASAAGFQPLDLEWTIDTSRPVAALGFRLEP